MKSVIRVLAVSLVVVFGCPKCTPQPVTVQAPTTRELEAIRVPWTFEIQDMNRRPIGSLSVRFIRVEVPLECRTDGDWRRVVLVSFESLGEPAFPGRDPLSYKLGGGRLTISRNGVCDDYFMLTGELTDSALKGEYFSFGFGGGEQLGYVTGKPSN